MAAASPAAWFGSAALLPTDARLFLGALPTGLRVAVLPNAFPPNEVHATLFVNAGSLCEREREQGLAHVVEHAVFCGTEAFPTPESLRRQLTGLGLSFNADSNAVTDLRDTRYELTGPLVLPSQTAAAKAAATRITRIQAKRKR